MTWPMVRLNAICRPKQWKTISSSNLLDHGFPVYGANGQIGFYSEYTHENPTLMITCRGATCGSMNISVPKSYINGNAMALDSLDKERVDIMFLYYFLKQRGFQDVISGSAQPQITGQGLNKIEVPLPPLEEQKRIVAILDKADAIRQKRQQAIALTDDFLRSVFLDMFGDPITNPKGWDLSTIGKLGNVITGSTPSSKKTGMFDGDIPFVTPGDLETDAPVSRTLTDEGALNSRTCRKGTTLVCCIGATIGKIGIASRTSAFNQQINAIEWGSEIDDEFGFFAMKLMKATIISSAIQTTLPILNKSAFSALAMYLPPKNLQMKFSKIYKSTCQLNGENKKFTINSNILFDSLLQKSFSGQL